MRLVVGIQPVREAVRAHGSRLTEVLLEQGDHPQLMALGRFARDQGAKVTVASRSELDRRAQGVRHQGALALAPELALRALADLPVEKDSLFLALDEIQDPQNFGAVIRSAVAFGTTAVLWPEHSAAPLSPATFRASAGAIEHAVLCRVGSLPGALSELSARGVNVVGLDADADADLAATDWSAPSAIVVGSEGHGLRRGVRRACATMARLPMSGIIGSLNASVAAAVALYEARRQRRSEH